MIRMACAPRDCCKERSLCAGDFLYSLVDFVYSSGSRSLTINKGKFWLEKYLLYFVKKQS